MGGRRKEDGGRKERRNKGRRKKGRKEEGRRRNEEGEGKRTNLTLNASTNNLNILDKKIQNQFEHVFLTHYNTNKYPWNTRYEIDMKEYRYIE